jgi:hypothetical protein
MLAIGDEGKWIGTQRMGWYSLSSYVHVERYIKSRPRGAHMVRYESGWRLCALSGISESIWHSGYRWTGRGRPAGQSWHRSQPSQNQLGTPPSQFEF